MHSSYQRSIFAAEPENVAYPDKDVRRFALILDHRQWLQFIVDEWFIPNPPNSAFSLGVSSLVGELSAPTRRPVIAWINPSRLTKLNVQVRTGSEWTEVSVREVDTRAEELIWPAPVPLFAVDFFSTESDDARAWLDALSTELTRKKSGIPPLVIRSLSSTLVPPSPVHTNIAFMAPPKNWNALRGAAAMAVWAVPANEPWIQILASTLSTKSFPTIADEMDASWLRAMPWRGPLSLLPESEKAKLWCAFMLVISEHNYRSGWRPIEIFGSLVEQAVRSGITGDEFEEFLSETCDILHDRERINVQRGVNDPIGLIIQLILLRPTAEKFVTWKDELSSMAPVVWWAGATLSGFITGFRDLEPRFSGLAEGRKLIALRTWQIACQSDGEYWEDELTENDISWNIEEGTIKLTCAGIAWAERSENNRGKWYRANLSNKDIRRAAVELAEKNNPSCVKNSMFVKDTCIRSAGDGHLFIEGGVLNIKGTVEFILPPDAHVQRDLRDDDFRNWLVWGSIEGNLQSPPFDESVAPPPTARAYMGQLFPEASPEETVPGLIEYENFLSYDEEQDLVRLIDSLPWKNSLSRRVQHYGWEYDYKSATVSLSSKIGPLPLWAESLARRLIEKNLISEMPDQVIINEYLGNQGISKHIDSPSSFTGPVITISLLESWDMIFRHPDGTKVSRTLERGSAVILDGPARYEWTHEIPRRSKEKWGVRERRISLTFRKVNLRAISQEKQAGQKRPARVKTVKG